MVPGGDDQREEAFRLGDQPGDVRALPRLQDRAGAHRLHPAHAAAAPVSGAVPPARRLQRLAARAGRDRAPRAGRRRAAVRRRRRSRSRCRRCRWPRSGAAAGWLLLRLRVAGVLACLVTALQPTIELRQVTRAAQPRRGAGRRLAVDGGAAARRRPVARRAGGGDARARGAAAGGVAAGRPRGRPLHASATTSRPPPTASLREPPAADATRIGEALGDVRARYAGRDLGAVVVISDGIDTGRIGEGPLDADDAHRRSTRWARRSTPSALGEKSLRDLSVAAVLADQFAFVRTPASIEAVIRQTGLPDRQVEVTLERDGRPVASRGVVLRGDRSEEKIAFDWLPDHPGNFVFRISTPGAGRRGADEQQRAVVHAQGDPRSRARAAPVGPAVVGRTFPARDAAARSERRPGVVLHPAHREPTSSRGTATTCR